MATNVVNVALEHMKLTGALVYNYIFLSFPAFFLGDIQSDTLPMTIFKPII